MDNSWQNNHSAYRLASAPEPFFLAHYKVLKWPERRPPTNHAEFSHHALFATSSTVVKEGLHKARATVQALA
jgi:hypothetical protein